MSERLHVFHIGKTGGTALKDALLAHRDDAAYELLLHGHTVTLADVPRGERYMFVLREPISRFVSAFNGNARPSLVSRHLTSWRPPSARATARSGRPRRRRCAASAT